MVNIPYTMFLLTTVCIAVNSVESTNPDGLQIYGGGQSHGLGPPEMAENTPEAQPISRTVDTEIPNIAQEAPSSSPNDDDDEYYEIEDPYTFGTGSSATTAPTTTSTPDPTESATEYVPDAPRLPEVCMLEPEEGFCDSGVTRRDEFRLFFNHSTEECEFFSYSGCKGNGNNFETAEQCKERCQGQPYDLKEHARLPSVCKERVSKGTCVSPKGPELRYFYNQYNQSCQLFTFIGGEGNGNNFKTREECEDRCLYTPDGECALPSERGLCKGNFTRYHWDKELGGCKEFNYSGCAGNANNFGSQEECQKFCEAKSTYLKLWKKVWNAMQSWISRGYS
uniref:Putative salivary kunitz domain protein n=1 Tax=Ixodes ricinus TaxID=34613 RepID=A0A147BWQ2_IXORI